MTLVLLVVNLGQSGHPSTKGDTLVHFRLSPSSLIEACIWKREDGNTNRQANTKRMVQEVIIYIYNGILIL